LDTTKKFTGKADLYSKYRPRYPKKYINYLVSYNKLTSNNIVVDIGSGTGVLTEQLLDKRLKVIAVEPNDDMRSIAEKRLNNHPKFVSIKGTAENTGLRSKSIDLITVAQAFHWFDKVKFKNECIRILKPNLNVALVWNSRDSSSQMILENAEICKNLCPSFNDFSGGIKEASEEFEQFFRDGKYEYRTFQNDLEYYLDDFVGRNLSASYAPKSTDSNYKEFVKALTELFMKYSKDNKIILPNVIRSYIGKV
jgi:ubiquinone/menaquinone biosynthesis C-methylase UbiE